MSVTRAGATPPSNRGNIMTGNEEHILSALKEVAASIATLSAKMDAILVMGSVRETKGDMERGEARALIRTLTAKQHAVSQMVVLGISEHDMAKRMGVSRNTIKLHIRALYSKLRTNDRSVLAVKLSKAFDAIDANEYQATAYGLPKSWAATWTPECPYRRIYAPNR